MKHLLSGTCLLALTTSLCLAQTAPKPATPPAAPAKTAPAGKTVKLLSIGNSFSRNATRYIGDLAKADGNELIHRPVIVGGASFELHDKRANAHEKDPKDKAGLYTSGRSLKQELTAEKWDFITVQQSSIKSHDLETYRPFAASLVGHIRKHAPKAEVLMHQTWAYRVDDARFTKPPTKPGAPTTQEAMYEGLTHAYQTVAAELGIRRIPVGDAFYLADTDAKWGFKPDTKFDTKSAVSPALPKQLHSLHAGWRWKVVKDKKSLSMDGHHANAAGEYLGGCVWYETLFGQSVVDNKFVPAGLDPKYARFLRETAHRAVLAAASSQKVMPTTKPKPPVVAPLPPPSKKVLDLALEAPELITEPGPEYADNVRWGNMIIGIDRTPKGRLWSCWVGNGDNPNGFFMLATSDDGGTTWSKPRLIINPTDPQEPKGTPQRRALVGNLWTDPSGKLWLFFDQSLGYFDGRCGDWYTVCENPDADQPVWSKPVRFADGCTLNKPTVLKNGEWMLPVSLWDRGKIGPAVLKEAHKDLDKIRMANVYVSKDKGKTWTRRGGVPFPNPQFDEHMVVELRDGRLWMLGRTSKDLSESFSSDGGKTWSPAQPSAILNVSSRFFIRRLASGKLLLVKNGPTTERLPKRSHMMAFLSDDDGKTWQGGLLLDERAEVSYPDGFQDPKGVIHILYDWNRHTDAEILLAKFREEDVLAKSFGSPGARTGILVNKATGEKVVAPAVPGPGAGDKQAGKP